MESCNKKFLQSLSRFFKCSTLIFLIFLMESPAKSWAAPNKSPVAYKYWAALDKSPVASESPNSSHYPNKYHYNVPNQPDLFDVSSSHEAERTPGIIKGSILMAVIVFDICLIATIIWLCTALNEVPVQNKEKALAVLQKSAAQGQIAVVSKNEYLHYPFKPFVNSMPGQQLPFAPIEKEYPGAGGNAIMPHQITITDGSALSMQTFANKSDQIPYQVHL